MKIIHIAAWFFLLTMGAISPIAPIDLPTTGAAAPQSQSADQSGHTGDLRSVAFSPDSKTIVSASLGDTMGLRDTVTGSQTQVSGDPAPSAASTAQSEDEIDDKNWQQNPKIIAIRKIVNSVNAEVRSGALKTEHRVCDQDYFVRLRIARDSKGVVRWYQHYREGEDSSWDDNYYYDDAGRLRFVLMTCYAINETREHHRAYFDESGNLIYHGRQLLKGPGYFGPQVDDFKEFLKMDPKKDFAEAGDGCKVIKSSTKHPIRKS